MMMRQIFFLLVAFQAFYLFILLAFYEFGIISCAWPFNGCAWMRSWKMFSMPLSIGISRSQCRETATAIDEFYLKLSLFILHWLSAQSTEAKTEANTGQDSGRAFPFDLALTDLHNIFSHRLLWFAFVIRQRLDRILEASPGHW